MTYFLSTSCGKGLIPWELGGWVNDVSSPLATATWAGWWQMWLPTTKRANISSWMRKWQERFLKLQKVPKYLHLFGNIFSSKIHSTFLYWFQMCVVHYMWLVMRCVCMYVWCMWQYVVHLNRIHHISHNIENVKIGSVRSTCNIQVTYTV